MLQADDTNQSVVIGYFRNFLYFRDLGDTGRSQWVSMIFDYSGTGTFKVFVDGVEFLSTDISAWSGDWKTGDANIIAICGDPITTVFNPWTAIQDYAFHQKALTVAERLTTYTGFLRTGADFNVTYESILQNVIKSQNPTWYWAFDGDALTTNDSIIVVYDEMHNANLGWSSSRDGCKDSSRADGFGFSRLLLSHSAAWLSTNQFATNDAYALEGDFSIEFAMKEDSVTTDTSADLMWVRSTDDFREVWEVNVVNTAGVYTLELYLSTAYNAGTWVAMADLSTAGYTATGSWAWYSIVFDAAGDAVVKRNDVVIGTVAASSWATPLWTGFAHVLYLGGRYGTEISGVDDVAIYQGGLLTPAQQTDTYNAWIYDGAATNNPVFDPILATPVEWQWESKEFYIPDRSYGACKLTGVFDATNTVNVILNVDGVDQPAFMVDPTATQPVGVCDGEYTFRLPAVRGSKFILKLSTAAGAPEVHSVQVAVHPTEII